MLEPATFVILGAGIALLVTAIVAGVAIAFPPTMESSSAKKNYKAFLSLQRQKRSSTPSETSKLYNPHPQPNENDHAKVL